MFVRFWTKADKVEFWWRAVCPLLTQSGHGLDEVITNLDTAPDLLV